MKRVLVRSRSGNLCLAVLGAIYALSSLAVFAWFVIDVWDYARLLDRLLQGALIASAVCGLWFIAIALGNLGLGRKPRLR